MNNKLKIAQEELNWFFWQGESDCGIHSNYATLFSALLYAMSATEAEVVDIQSYTQMAISEASSHRTLGAISKYRKILKKYQSISASAKVILEKYYEERQFHPEMQDFGPGINLIPHTQLGREMEKQFLQNPSDKLIKHFKSVKKGLKKQVHQLYLSALQEYAEVI